MYNLYSLYKNFECTTNQNLIRFDLINYFYSAYNLHTANSNAQETKNHGKSE